MNVSIEDLINNWKLEMDSQVEKFEKSAETIRNFEFMFQDQYTKVFNYFFKFFQVGFLSELINKISENGENTVSELNDILKEEDHIIDNLDSIENFLDKYLNVVLDKKNLDENLTDIDDKIYTSTLECETFTTEIQKEIDLIQNNINNQTEFHLKKVENLRSFKDEKAEVALDVIKIILFLNFSRKMI